MISKRDKNKLEMYLKKSLLLDNFKLSAPIKSKDSYSHLLKYKDILLNNFKFLSLKNNNYNFPTRIEKLDINSNIENNIFLIKKNKNIFFFKKHFRINNIKIFLNQLYKHNLIKYNNFYLYYIKQKESKKLS